MPRTVRADPALSGRRDGRKSDPNFDRRHMLRKYRLSMSAYENMLCEQNGCCYICHKLVPGNMYIDHDHNCCPEKKRSCGYCIRALLCGSCNNGLGRFFDNPILLRRAATYLESHHGA